MPVPTVFHSPKGAFHPQLGGKSGQCILARIFTGEKDFVQGHQVRATLAQDGADL
jgi:hypothetical protein